MISYSENIDIGFW